MERSDPPEAGLPPLREDEKSAILARGRAVPIAATLGLEFVRLERGLCSIRMVRDRRFDGIYESLHGGLLMTLADSAGAFAVLTLIPVDESITTTEMNIRFLAPVRGAVTAEARVLKVGRTLCPIDADLIDDDGRLVAHAGMTYMRVRRDPTEGESPR
jgi:uncharacterized protein (TIGR00369 family)